MMRIPLMIIYLDYFKFLIMRKPLFVFLNVVIGYCCIRLMFRGGFHDPELFYIGISMIIAYVAIILMICSKNY
jgi:hypothetical protein